MDATQIFSFMAVATLLVISPGPNGVLVAKTVPVSGKSAGFANVAGFVAAFYIHGSLSIMGISILLVQSSQAFFIFKILGAAYLCWIGIKSLQAAWRHGQAVIRSELNRKRTSMVGAFVEGFLTNLLNPKVSMFYLAAFPQFMSIDDGAYQAYVLVSAHAFVNLVWFSAMVLLLSRMRELATDPSFTKWVRSVTGVVFLGFGAKLAFLKPLNNS